MPGAELVCVADLDLAAAQAAANAYPSADRRGAPGTRHTRLKSVVASRDEPLRYDDVVSPASMLVERFRAAFAENRRASGPRFAIG